MKKKMMEVPSLPVLKCAAGKKNKKPSYPKVLTMNGTINRERYDALKGDDEALRNCIEKDVKTNMMNHVKPWPEDPKWDSIKRNVNARFHIIGLRYDTEGHINARLTFSRAEGAKLERYEVQIFNKDNG